MAQVFVNKEWVEYAGLADSLHWSATTLDSQNNVIVTGTTIVAPGNTDVLTTKYDRSGNVLWAVTANGSASALDRGVAIAVDASDQVYVAGAAFNGSTFYDVLVLKYASDGTLIWSHSWNGPSSLNDFPTSLAIDAFGNIVVAGGTQTLTTDWDMAILKLDPDGIEVWSSTYDHVGLFDIAAGVALGGGSDPVVSGASAVAMNKWEQTTVKISGIDGSIQSVYQVATVGIGLDQVTAVAHDVNGNIYLTGYTEEGNNRDIQTVKLNPTLGLLWIETYGAAGLHDEARTLAVDDAGNVLVAGFAANAMGGTDLVTLKYDPTGDLLWEARRKCDNPTWHAEANSLSVNSLGEIAVTGTIVTAAGTDMIALKYKATGELVWEKRYDGPNGGNDKAFNIVADGEGNYYVTGLSHNMGANQTYVVLKYAELKHQPTLAEDPPGTPVAADNEIVVRFAPEEVDADFAGNTGLQFAKMEDILSATLLTDIKNKSGVDLSKQYAIKIYQSVTPDLEYVTSKLGRQVPVPPLWASLRVLLPTGADIHQVLPALNDRTSPDPLFPRIRYAEPNWVPQLGAVVPNDPLYATVQPALHFTATYPNAHVNAEGAWALGAWSDPSVKIGIFDTGIRYIHEDFNLNEQTGTSGSLSGTKIAGGRDYLTGTNDPIQAVTNPDPDGHGTWSAGIAGAIRNNGIGLSSIGGGDKFDDNLNTGAALYAMKIMGAGGWGIITDAYQAMQEGVTEFDLDVYSNSWNIRPGGTLFTAYSIQELKTITRFCFETERTMVFIKGNEGTDASTYPNNYYPDHQVGDDWVITVNASGTNGERKTNLNGTPSYNSNWGPQTDVMAPGCFELNETTANAGTGYTDYSGTSSAAPYVSSLATALIHAHVYGPLAPEDVEHIIEYGAADRGAAGYDTQTGWGLLDCGASATLTQFPYYRVVHYEAQPTSGVSLGNNFYVDNLLGDYNQYPAGSYWVERFEYTATVNHVGLGPDAQIMSLGPDRPGYWIRNSGSNLWGPVTGPVGNRVLVPEPGVEFVGTPTIASATVRGYHYGLQYILLPPATVTVPVSAQPGGEPNRMAYSLLVYDPLTTAVEENAQGMHSMLYPNPTQQTASIRYMLFEGGQVELRMTDAAGRLVQHERLGSKPAGEHVFQFDLTSLANGVYVIHLNTPEGHAVHRVLKGR
jgi:subtilisin family serine protease